MSTLVPERTWLQRNTKWVVLGAIVGGLLLLGAFIAGILMLVSAAMRSSDVYVTSVARAQADQRGIELLGDPVESGLLVSGSVQVKNTEGSADLAIPLSGPRGDASLAVVASKRGGRWTFTRMLVTPGTGTGRSIDLLRPEERDASGENLK